MNNNGGAISFDALINNSQFLKSFQEMEERIKGFTNKATAEAEKTDTVFSKLGKAIENTFTSDNLREVAQQIIKVRGEFQALEGSLKVMLGSKEKADELMAQVADLAAKTPLSLTQVGESAKLMVAYGFSTDTVIGHLQMLGDVAHGVNMPIEDLVNTFGAIRTNGVASLSDIEGMAGKGIPIFEVLGNVLNTNRDGVEKMVEASKVGLPQIELAFQSMTSTGGMFSGVMKEQAKSVDALMTNLEESINRVYNEIGKDTDGLVAGTLQMGVSMLENYQSIAKIIEVLAIAYGVYKAALLVVNATEAAAIAIKGGWTIATLAEYQALLLVEGAQKVLNATMLANPYVAVTTLIIGLASAVYLFNTNTAIAERAQNKCNQELAESTKKINNLKDETNKLNNVIRNNTSTHDEQLRAYEELQKLYPDMLKNIDLYKYKTMDATKSQKEFNAALTGIKIGDIKNKIAEVDKRIADNKKRQSDLFTKPQLGVTGGVSSMQFYLNNQLKEDKALRNALAKQYIDVNKTLINERKEAEKEGNVKNKEYWDKELKQLQTEFDKQEKNTKKFLELKATIKKVKKELKSYEVSDSEEDKPHNTPAPKTPAPTAPAPYGSIAYWQEISSKAQYIYEHSNNPSEKIAQIAVVLDAEKKVAEGRKQLEEELSKGKIKTFEEEIEEKKKQYVLYENWVKNISKEVADAHPQFKDLLPQGNNYVDFLSKKIKEFETKQNDVNLDPTAKTEAQGNLVKYKIEYQIVTGKKSGVELLKEDMLKAKKEAKSLVEYLEYIEKLKEKLKGDTSTEGIAQTNTLVEETNQTNEQIATNLQEYLRNHETYEEQKDNIIKKHKGLREDLESQYIDKTNAEYLKNKEKLEKGEKKELDELKKTQDEKLASYKALLESLKVIDLKYLKEKVETEKNTLKKIKDDGKENTDDYIKQLKVVQDAEKNLNDHLLSVVSKFASLGGQLGGVMSKMNGAIGDTGQLLSGLAQNADNLVNAFKKGATSTDKWMTGITATIGLIDFVNDYQLMIPLQATKLYLSGLVGQNYNLTKYTVFTKAVSTAQLSTEQERITKLENGSSNLLSGKTFLHFGTSIPEGGRYPTDGPASLGGVGINMAVGSSTARISRADGSYNGLAYQNFMYALARKKSEIQTLIDTWDTIKGSLSNNPPDVLTDAEKTKMLACSYEYRLLPYLDGTKPMPDFFIFDHGRNDGYSNDLSVIPAQRDDRRYFIGAMNYLIDLILKYNKFARIAFVGHYENDLLTPVSQAQEVLADYWGFPLLRMWEKTGFSQQIVQGSKSLWTQEPWSNYTNGQNTTLDMNRQRIYLPDGIHPHAEGADKNASKLLTKIYANFIKDLV
ncbi:MULTISPECIES: tape measure protein [unclassified Arcicella]|uniref:tape measure protein n=1 Tax=unclassified Arcicella TaxID=2644986 RepID=UPI0028678D1A|nr:MULTISPECIES: tape measure protein [unclassified Arcicella]MDR6564685.1 hypothetical protein [Arcicella sp. BE51]MDR6814387.1 hypothetical protein [Arcicella sp. BE140]MDR6825858.1 hypothetical protein [Arcicella sp. BE139]